MKMMIVVSAVSILALSAFAQPPADNSPESGSISIQKMLITGPAQLKLHSLLMIKQGSISEPIDSSFLPGLRITAEHTDPVLRNITAQILGQYFIQNKEEPNSEALSLITKLGTDESKDVRFNATYYGLTQVKYKTPELAELLINLAATERNPALQDRIIVSLANYQPQVEEILNEKLKSDNAISYYEIYEEFTGKEPPNADKFLDMPSTRPHLIIIKPSEKNAEAAKTALTTELKKAGIENPTIQISGKGDNSVLMLTTYMTRDYQTAKAALFNHEAFPITQDMWLTPELEIQIEAMRKTQD